MQTSMLELYSERTRHCGFPYQLVRSRSGGLVARNCVVCNQSRRVGLQDLPAIACESCGRPTRAQISSHDRNYWYACACGEYFRLADRLPQYREYCGLAMPSDRAE